MKEWSTEVVNVFFCRRPRQFVHSYETFIWLLNESTVHEQTVFKNANISFIDIICNQNVERKVSIRDFIAGLIERAKTTAWTFYITAIYIDNMCLEHIVVI